MSDINIVIAVSLSVATICFILWIICELSIDRIARKHKKFTELFAKYDDMMEKVKLTADPDDYDFEFVKMCFSTIHRFTYGKNKKYNNHLTDVINESMFNRDAAVYNKIVYELQQNNILLINIDFLTNEVREKYNYVVSLSTESKTCDYKQYVKSHDPIFGFEV